MTTSDQYAVFKKFSYLDQAKEFARELKKSGIDCKLIDNSPAVDITFSGNTLQNQIELLVKQSDFAKANNFLDQQAESEISQVSKDHYLFEFTNEELYDVLLKLDEWSTFDYKLAQSILTDRGQPINQDLVRSLKKQRIEDLAKPEQGQSTWIYAGYIFAFLGGLLGLFIGWHLWTYKKTLPDGQKVYAYSAADRKHGRIISLIGGFLFPLWFALRILTEK